MIAIGPEGLAAGVHALRQAMTEAGDDAIANEIGLAGLTLLHALFVHGVPAELEAAAEEEGEAEEAAPEESEAETEAAEVDAAALSWTPARDAVLREHWPGCTDMPALLAEINALPGRTISTVGAMGLHARRVLGLRPLFDRRQLNRPPSPYDRPPAVWTEARNALMREKWPHAEDLDALLAEINTLDGHPVSNKEAMGVQAHKLGLKPQTQRRRAIAPAARLARDAPPPVTESDEAEAERLIRESPHSRGARWLQDEYGWEAGRAQAFVARVRDGIAAEARPGAAA